MRFVRATSLISYVVHTVRTLIFFFVGRWMGSPQWGIYTWQKTARNQCLKFGHVLLLDMNKKIQIIYQFKSVHSDLGCNTMWN